VKNEMKNINKNSTTKKLKESPIKDHAEKAFNDFIAQSLVSGGSHIVANKSHGKTRLMFAICEKLQRNPNIRNIVFDGSETWLYSASRIPVLTIGDHDILKGNRKTTEDLERFQLQNENLVKLALATKKDLLFRLKSRSPSKRGFFVRFVVNLLDEQQRTEKAKSPEHLNKKCIAYFIEEAQDCFNSRSTQSSEAEEFLTVFNEARNQKEAFFTASQRLNDFSKTIRSKQHLAIGSLSLEDITPSLRRLEKQHNLDFSRMKAKTWFYEGLVFNSPEFKQNKKPFQINKELKAQLTPETPEQRRETLSDKVLKWLNPQKYLDLQIKKLAEAQKQTPKSLLKKNGNKEASHDFEELEEKELNDTLSEEERANLEEERDLREIEEEMI
jgi:hypothetical protein